ncbi:CE1759 family FMN reductase [Streptomyces sp. NPDC002159]
MTNNVTQTPHINEESPEHAVDPRQSAGPRHAAGSAGASLSLVVVSGGVSDPSSTKMLANRIADKTVGLVRRRGPAVDTRIIDLAPLAVDIARAVVSGFPHKQLRESIRHLAAADGVIVASPVYTAGVSGLLKSFFDVLDNDLIVAKPTLLSATAGSSRHALVVDDQIRSMLAFMRALTVPTSVFAAPEDWGAPELGERIDRAAAELATLMISGVGNAIVDSAWTGYQHHFGGNATRAEQTSADVDFDTPMMRLAAGGTSIGQSEPVK